MLDTIDDAAMEARPREELGHLRQLKARAAALASTHLDALDFFYLSRDLHSLTRLRGARAEVGGFGAVLTDPSVVRDGTARSSLGSTAACVRSLTVCPEVKPGRADFGSLVAMIVERYTEGTLTSGGIEHLNAFTLGQVLPTLRDVAGNDVHPGLGAMIDEALARLSGALSGDGVVVAAPPSANGDTTPPRRPHGYLTYGALSAVAAWSDDRTLEAASPSVRWSETELYRQIALFQTGHDERFDAYQLGYNLLIQYRFNRRRLGSSLIELGLQTLFSAQLDRGVWEKRDPLFRHSETGETYCFSFELLSSLLRDLRQEWWLLVPFEDKLVQAMDWAARNAVLHHDLPVWRSAHLVEETMPEAWATAEVYSFLQLFTAYLTWRVQSIVKDRFRSQPARSPNPEAFDPLYQPEVRRAADEPILLGELLKEHLLEPLRLPGKASAYSLVRSADPTSKARSGILYGPPGTGKTTYVRKVAEYLGWPLVVLDPSVFAAEGLPLIATVASRLFGELLELEDTVIFFDEMEALVHSRADASGSFEQKFLTTSLLPKLQELADRAACLFFVATNHFDTMDRAAQRPGRFDFTLQILPPSYEETLRLAEDTLGRDLFRALEADLRRRPYQENLRLATRNEMLALCEALRHRPEQAEKTLSHFKAELAADGAFREELVGTALG
ncbi:MAG TPA: ATP-binding protein [Acidimicrobiales bacterium]|nr:ATP-binding protein [Acidimicrobiales bacterium]